MPNYVTSEEHKIRVKINYNMSNTENLGLLDVPHFLWDGDNKGFKLDLHYRATDPM